MRNDGSPRVLLSSKTSICDLSFVICHQDEPKRILDRRALMRQCYPPFSMTSYEIFGRCSSQLANEIFGYLLEKEKPVYRAVIQNLANQRKLRPVFIERKPKPERHTWLQQALARKPADDLATQVFQIWLLGGQQPLICEFLDALEIKHDGKGVVDQLPAEPEPAKLQAAIDLILGHHSPETVTIYLHLFRTMDDAGWKHLGEILDNDARLKLGPVEAQQGETTN